MFSQLTEQAVHLITKTIILISAWVFAVSSSLAESTIDKAFDLGFSIGLLVIFVVYMYLENKRKTRQRDDAQQKNTEMLELNIQAMHIYAQSNADIARSVEKSAEIQARALEKLTDAFSRFKESQS